MEKETQKNSESKPNVKLLRIGTGLPGPGRKRKALEQQVTSLALTALKKKHGSIGAAFQALLDSKEPGLIKFVYEHAFGKPTEKAGKDNGPQFPQINLQLVTNNNTTNDTRSNDSSEIHTG